jgi:hypothetical protein
MFLQLAVTQLVKKIPFMERESSSSSSQRPANEPCVEPDAFSSH